MIELPDSIIATIQLGVAGFIGVCLRMLQKKRHSLKAWLIEVFTGVACAVYLTPLASSLIEMDENTEGGVAFLIGYTGLVVVSIVQEKFLGIKGEE